MPSSRYHLAQVNIAHLIEPLTSDRLADFVAALEPVNATADTARVIFEALRRVAL